MEKFDEAERTLRGAAPAEGRVSRMATKQQHLPPGAAIFERLYAARMRQSLFELEALFCEMEALPKPRGGAHLAYYETLRCFYGEALTECEKRLATMRTRFAALPVLPAAKEVEEKV
jgi:hypothetical protein